MIDRDTAKQATDHILEAIKHISSSVRLIEGRYPPATLEAMRRTAGLAIGTLDTEYLAHVYLLSPELDRLFELDAKKPISDEL